MRIDSEATASPRKSVFVEVFAQGPSPPNNRPDQWRGQWNDAGFSVAHRNRLPESFPQHVANPNNKNTGHSLDAQ
ncbi:MAG: hypothetical protein ABIV39_04190 [Verrucomicrobiota bacterium]